jgi:hypothetical protein
MNYRNSISMLTTSGLAAIASACSTPSANQTVQKVDLPPGSVGRLDTQTARSLGYTLREDNHSKTFDTQFSILLGGGRITIPLEPFYGPTLAGHVGAWSVDGRGRVAKIAGSSTPGFLTRLESMPDGSIYIGQQWEHVTPSDAEAMASSDIVMQLKRRWHVVEAFNTPTGIAVRVEVDGWSRLIENSALTQLMQDARIDNIQPNWTPSLEGAIDVEIQTGTLLGMRLYEDLFGDAASTDELAGTAGSSTYCINSSTGFTPRADICGWNP